MPGSASVGSHIIGGLFHSSVIVALEGIPFIVRHCAVLCVHLHSITEVHSAELRAPRDHSGQPHGRAAGPPIELRESPARALPWTGRSACQARVMNSAMVGLLLRTGSRAAWTKGTSASATSVPSSSRRSEE